jgi:AcrR family transcriptional regulator
MLMQWDCNVAPILHSMAGDVNTLRARRIADTENRIVTAAHELFVRNGYLATSLAAVADAAGLGHRTVYVRFGTKAALLKRVMDVAIVGDTAPVDLAGQEWHRAVHSAATLDERVDLMAAGTAELMARVADVMAVAVQAAASEPLIADALAAARAATRDAVFRFFHGLREDGLIAADVDLDWLSATASLLAHPQTYLLGRETLDWSIHAYREWRRTTWRRLIAAAGP